MLRASPRGFSRRVTLDTGTGAEAVSHALGSDTEPDCSLPQRPGG